MSTAKIINTLLGKFKLDFSVSLLPEILYYCYS